MFLGKSFSQQRMGFSEEVNSAIDREVHRLINEGYKRAESILTEHMDKLHALADLLLEREKLDADEFKAFMETGAVPEKAPAAPQQTPPAAPDVPERRGRATRLRARCACDAGRRERSRRLTANALPVCWLYQHPEAREALRGPALLFYNIYACLP